MFSEFRIDQYLSDSIENIIKGAIKASLKNPKESLFIAKYSMSSREAAIIREKYELSGKHIPSFLMSSITNDCNLRCKGCYSRANNAEKEHHQKVELSVDEWKRIFKEATELGISFILMAGGEPFMRPEVIEAAAGYKKIFFPIFTNGTMLRDRYIKLLNKNRNLLPVISIEGEEEYTDLRRGKGIYSHIKLTMQGLKEKGIFFGASITVTKENYHNILGNTFLSELYQGGCKVVFFIEYVPVNSSTKHLILTDQDRDEMDRRLRLYRLQFEEMLIVSFPGDEKSSGGCLAAGRGFFHINSDGSAEPCPFSPYSDTNVRDCTLLEALQSPLFKSLTSSDVLLREHKGGCVLFDQEEEVKRICKGII